MRLISFDVGIKHLAYCIFDISGVNTTICDWNVVNLMELDTPTGEQYTCSCPLASKQKSKKHPPQVALCGKRAKYSTPAANTNSVEQQAQQYYCDSHAKKQIAWLLPKKENTEAKLKSAKLPDLVQRFHSVFPDRVNQTAGYKKQDYINALSAHYYAKTLLPVEAKAKQKAGDVNLIQVGRAIRTHLDGNPNIAGVDCVIIENQISTIASRMKTIQGMIAQYFVMRMPTLDQKAIEQNKKENIFFVSSKNKLKGFERATKTQDTAISQSDASDKTNYKANKKDGVTICRQFLEANEYADWITIFSKSTKKDDLADCFLQGIWYLKSQNIITYAENLKINNVAIS